MFADYALTDIGCRIDFSYQGDTFANMETIGTRIRNRRLELKLGQVKLGELIGTNQSTISNIEGGAGFGADILMSLCDELSVTPEYLMRGSESDDAGEAEILWIYRKLDDANRVAFLAMARGLSSNTQLPPLSASAWKSKFDGQTPLARITRTKPRKTRKG